MPGSDISSWIENIIAGQKMAVADALNLLENRNPRYAETIQELVGLLCQKARPHRHLIGISGPPGAGKSSMISRLIEKYRAQNQTVGVLSVDPSSPKTGGALLGDRIRIRYDPSDQGVFIRSMAASGHLGGLALNTRLNLMVFEAAYDKIILETVGVGQSETEIEYVVDSVVVVIQPGSGDTLQFMKAGIMEIPNVLVINKADHEQLAAKAFNELNRRAADESAYPLQWQMKVIKTSAVSNTGFSQLVDTLEKHHMFLENNNIANYRKRHLHQWIVTFFKDRFGSFGVDMLGGVEKIISMLQLTAIEDPFSGIGLLTDQVNKKLGLS